MTAAPDHLTVWFTADRQAGLDVRWGGHAGIRRATSARDRLVAAGHPATLVQDELGWRVCLGPLDRSVIGEIVGRFLERI